MENLQKKKRIRQIVTAVLILELAFFLREAGLEKWIRISVQESVYQETGEGTHTDRTSGEGEKVYGIQFRPGDGSIDFYQKEELQKSLVTEE